MRKSMIGCFAVLATIGVASSASAQRVVYLHGNIFTMEAARPRAEALVCEGGRIVVVGSEAEVLAAMGEGARKVDLGGATVLPGLIDAHGHMAGLGSFGMGVLELSRARSFGEVVERVVERVRMEGSPKGEGEAAGKGDAPAAERQAAQEQATPGGEKKDPKWVMGGRWDHESWSSKELPTHTELSKAVPDRPVWLRRVDGHAGLANKKAMELAGVNKDTPSPAGGEIIRDGKGEPTGVFVDNAMSLITRRIPAGAMGSSEDLLLKAQEMCLAAGLTGVHDAGVSPAEIGVYQRLVESGKLKIRVYAMVAGPYAMKWFEEHAPVCGDRLSVRAAKLYMDGAMGSRGAWMLEPYADRPRDGEGRPYTGLAVSKPELIEAVARHAVEKGYQVCTHAIGDRGNRKVLDAYERAGAVGKRFRIEHAQLLSLADVPRFARLGVIPSMQPTHCTSDMRWVDERVGAERARGAYAWGTLLKTGVRIAGGSDFPVESHNPFLGIYAAVTRCDEDGKPEGGWHPSEKMTREEAVRAFTIDAAYAGFAEGDRGSLAVGKWADFVVVDRDVMVCGEREILGTRVLKTVVGGEEVFVAGVQKERG